MAACAECGRPADYALSDDSSSVALCASCMERVTGNQGLHRLRLALERPRVPAEKCPYCGTTAEEVVKTGMAGCPLCYQALDEAWRQLGV